MAKPTVMQRCSVPLILALALSVCQCRGQVTETVAVGRPWKIPAAGGPFRLSFRPAASVATPSTFNRTDFGEGATLVPDVPGEYVLESTSSAGVVLFVQAVNLWSWATGSERLMSDVFGNGSAPENTNSAQDFWHVLDDVENCRVLEAGQGHHGLVITTASNNVKTNGGLCGVVTRPLCQNGSAAVGCGNACGPVTVNPFSDRVMVSLTNLTLAAHSTAGLQLRAGGGFQGDNQTLIALEYSNADGGLTLGWGTLGIAGHWSPIDTYKVSTDSFANLSMIISMNNYTVLASGRPLMAGAHGIDWRRFAGASWGDVGVAIIGRGAVTVGAFSAESLLSHGRMPAVLAPISNLNGFTSPYLGQSHPVSFTARGYLDPTKPPFSADPSGREDATGALRAAVEYARRNYLTLWLPSGEYLVSDTITCKETERLDAIDGTHDHWQQARYVPTRWVGTTAPGSAKPVLVLAENTFTNRSEPRPVVWFWMQNGANGTSPPPYSGGHSQPNANCNQVFQGIDIRISSGNPGAIGIRARGAQMMVVQDVTVFAGDGLIGLSGGAGSGGSHYGVTVIGGRYGVDYTTAQPGPVITGFTLVNQSCSALVYAGLQTLTAVGLRIKQPRAARQPAILTGCAPSTNTVPDWAGLYFQDGCELPQFVPARVIQPCDASNSGALTLVDSIVDIAGGDMRNSTSVAIAAAASLYAVNLHSNARIIATFHGGNEELAAVRLCFPRNGHRAWKHDASETLCLPSPGSHRHTCLLRPSQRLSHIPSPGAPHALLAFPLHCLQKAGGYKGWTTVAEYAHGVNKKQGEHSFSSLVHLADGRPAPSDVTRTVRSKPPDTLRMGIVASPQAPNDSLATRHLYNGSPARSLPNFESPNAVDAAAFGVLPNGQDDAIDALNAALAAATRLSPPGVLVLGRGVFRVSQTLVIPSGVSVVGAGLHLTSIVPMSTGFASNTPVVRVSGGQTVVAYLSVTTWAHYAAVPCVEWRGGSDSLWFQSHVNRMTECGISGGNPLRYPTASPLPLASWPVPVCRPEAMMSAPLFHVSGGGSFYNFYNEDAVGSMEGSALQGPDYRHMLVTGADVRFYVRAFPNDLSEIAVCRDVLQPC